MGYYNADGAWIHEENDIADPGAGFSELLNKGTETVPAQVRNRVTAELQSDPTIRQAAINLVNEEVGGLEVVRRTDPGAPNARNDLEELLIAIVDSLGHRSWLEASAADGGPTRWALELFRNRTGLSGLTAVPGYLLALTDSQQRMTDLSIRDTDGQFAQFVVERLAARIGPILGRADAPLLGLQLVPILAARLAASKTDAQPCAIVFAGSSTTANSGVTAAQGYVNQVVAALQARYPSGGAESAVQTSTAGTFTPTATPGVHGYNIGLGGTTADTYLTDAKSDTIAALNPAAIVHMVGSNDFRWQVLPETYRAQLVARLDYLDSKMSQPCQHLLIHPYERRDVPNPAHPWKAYGDALASIADARRNTAFLDISRPYATNGLPASDPLTLIRSDKVHQEVRGYKFMADLIIDALL